MSCYLSNEAYRTEYIQLFAESRPQGSCYLPNQGYISQSIVQFRLIRAIGLSSFCFLPNQDYWAQTALLFTQPGLYDTICSAFFPNKLRGLELSCCLPNQGYRAQSVLLFTQTWLQGPIRLAIYPTKTIGRNPTCYLIKAIMFYLSCYLLQGSVWSAICPTMAIRFKLSCNLSNQDYRGSFGPGI